MTRTKLIGVRDPLGVRPLVLELKNAQNRMVVKQPATRQDHGRLDAVVRRPYCTSYSAGAPLTPSRHCLRAVIAALGPVAQVRNPGGSPHPPAGRCGPPASAAMLMICGTDRPAASGQDRFAREIARLLV